FDIQLSCHTHKGQIFPFNYPVRLRYRYIAGLYDLGKASRIYTSRGTGTWGPPLRLLSPAEVTIITISPES
ncbi:MAG: metallophosphoesterase, partial [Pseudomonadota bacterium]